MIVDTVAPASPRSRPAARPRDRLELLTALIGGTGIRSAVPRSDVIRIPPKHPVYPWQCTVIDCERRHAGPTADLCAVHIERWRDAATPRGMTKSMFVHTAEPLTLNETGWRRRGLPDLPGTTGVQSGLGALPAASRALA